jgi:hypothetical protein
MSSSELNSKKSNSLELILPYCFSLLLLTVVGYLLSAPHLALKDISEFYAPGSMLLSGNPADVYKPESLQLFAQKFFPGHEAPILYIPPFALPLLIPLGCLPVSLADPIWFGFLILCGLASVIVLKLTLNLQDKYLMRIAGLLCISAPEWEAVRHGQLAPILLLSLCLALYVFRREQRGKSSTESVWIIDSNAFASIALTPLLAKPQLILPIIVFLLGAGRYKIVAYLSAIGAVLSVVALELFGSETFTAYFVLLQRFRENRIWQAPDVTPTIRGQLLRIFPTADSTIMIVSLLSLCVGMVCVFLIARKFRLNPYWWEYLAIGALPIGLLTALHCHNYDLLLLLPTAVVFIFGNSTRSLTTKQKLFWLLTVTPLMMPLYNKLHYEYLLVGGTINILFLDLSIIAISSVVWLLFRHHPISDE